ncbi:DMT family transporter [Roseovarius sp.]|uniref:DMT family transporter n=1 Tax=Roseovarius sp. TaxID=1486281 RepID=UPI000C5F6DAB|nr:DMT family transporter [Roseovarius sp.]MAZ20923.1 EamA family transporter [Roseovarius sp.]
MLTTAKTGLSDSSSKLLLGTVLAWTAVIIYAAANSIVTILADIGAANPVNGRNAITFCNLLFLGSLISLIPMVVFFHKDWTRANLRALTRKSWLLLTTSALLSSAITPGLFFFALEQTTVTNVILIGRIDPPLFLLFAFLLLGEKLDGWALTGGLVSLVGAATIILLKEDGSNLGFGIGDLAALVATLSFIMSTLVTRAGLKDVPLGIFAIYRTALGTAIYFVIALYLYGPNHFQDLLEPVVLKWIWVYVVIVILMGQFAWNLALKHARTGDVALATSFSPLAGLIFAMILVGETPGPGLLPGSVILILGIAVAQYGRNRKARNERRAISEALRLEGSCNFKGS